MKKAFGICRPRWLAAVLLLTSVAGADCLPVPQDPIPAEVEPGSIRGRQ